MATSLCATPIVPWTSSAPPAFRSRCSLRSAIWFGSNPTSTGPSAKSSFRMRSAEPAGTVSSAVSASTGPRARPSNDTRPAIALLPAIAATSRSRPAIWRSTTGDRSMWRVVLS